MESLKGFFGVQSETRASAALATLSPFGAGKCSSPEDRFSWKDSVFQARAQETARRTTITSARLPLPILVSRSVCGWATLCKIQKMLRHWQFKRNENKVELPMAANDRTMIRLFKWQVSFSLYYVSFMTFFLSIKKKNGLFMLPYCRYVKEPVSIFNSKMSHVKITVPLFTDKYRFFRFDQQNLSHCILSLLKKDSEQKQPPGIFWVRWLCMKLMRTIKKTFGCN